MYPTLFSSLSSRVRSSVTLYSTHIVQSCRFHTRTHANLVNPATPTSTTAPTAIPRFKPIHSYLPSPTATTAATSNATMTTIAQFRTLSGKFSQSVKSSVQPYQRYYPILPTTTSAFSLSKVFMSSRSAPLSSIPNTKPLTAGEQPEVTKSPEEWKNQLNDDEYYVLRQAGTEARWKGYTNDKTPGLYSCKACGNPLFTSDMKFDSGCGWPSFDNCIPGSIVIRKESDGRTEELCGKCHSHLGHVFTGERFTAANVRHCINSICLVKGDVDESKVTPSE